MQQERDVLPAPANAAEAVTEQAMPEMIPQAQEPPSHQVVGAPRGEVDESPDHLDRVPGEAAEQADVCASDNSNQSGAVSIGTAALPSVPLPPPPVELQLGAPVPQLPARPLPVDVGGAVEGREISPLPAADSVVSVPRDVGAEPDDLPAPSNTGQLGDTNANVTVEPTYAYPDPTDTAVRQSIQSRTPAGKQPGNLLPPLPTSSENRRGSVASSSVQRSPSHRRQPALIHTATSQFHTDEMATSNSSTRRGLTGPSLRPGGYDEVAQDAVDQHNRSGVLVPPQLANTLQRRYGQHWQGAALRQIESTILWLPPQDMRILHATARSLQVSLEQVVTAVLSANAKPQIPLWPWDGGNTVAEPHMRGMWRASPRFSCRFVVLVLLSGMLVGLWLAMTMLYSMIGHR